MYTCNKPKTKFNRIFTFYIQKLDISFAYLINLKGIVILRSITQNFNLRDSHNKSISQILKNLVLHKQFLACYQVEHLSLLVIFDFGLQFDQFMPFSIVYNDYCSLFA